MSLTPKPRPSLSSTRTIDPSAPPLVNLATYTTGAFSRGRSRWVVMLWWLVQAIAFPLTPHPCNGLRVFLLRLFGAKVGRNVVIRPTARITFPWNVAIADYSWIGDRVVLYSLTSIRIGRHCVISQNSYLCTGSHDIHSPQFDLQTGAIVVGNGAWVATDSFIAPGVTIGANAVIGARSTVFASMPNQWVCWGTPCAPQHPRLLQS